MKKHQSQRILSNNLYMLGYIHRFCRKHIGITLATTLLGSISNIAGLLMSRYLINAISSRQDWNMTQMSRIFGMLTILAIYQLAVMWLGHYLNQVIIPQNTQVIYQKMQEELFEKAAQVELSCYEDSEFYHRFSLAMQQADSRALAVLNTLNALLAAFFGIGTLLTLLVGIRPFLLLFVSFQVIVTFLMNLRMVKKQHEWMEQKLPHQRKTEYVRRVYYLQNYAKEVRLYQSFQRVLKEKFETSVKSLQELIRSYGKQFTCLAGLQGSGGIISNTLTIFYLAGQAIKGSLLLGDFVILNSSVQQLSSNILTFLNIVPQLYEHSIYIEHFREFIEYQPKVYQTGTKNLDVITDVMLKQISFAYPNTERSVLQEINLSLHKGELVAVVGQNGAGKTTLVKLLSGLYEPTGGELYFNGQKAECYLLEKWQEQVGMMFQDYQVYAVSVAENVLMRPLQGDEDIKLVWKALQFCGLAEKIASLPDGLFSVMTREFGNEGVFLSGGELQKLALARLYIKECSLLILDEPSSALDPLAEAEVFRKMRELAKERCAIFISHRLSNIQDVDRIYVMEAGRIAECGTHIELMRQNGIYARMYQEQNGRDVNF